MAPATRPVLLQQAGDAASARTSYGDTVVLIVPAGATAGGFASALVTAAGDAPRPAYVNHAADEAIHVLDGAFTVLVDREPAVTLRPGDTLLVPRGALRRIAPATPDGARLLVTTTPGEPLDDVVRLLQQPTPGTPLTRHELVTALARCGIELVAPPVQPGQIRRSS